MYFVLYIIIVLVSFYLIKLLKIGQYKFLAILNMYVYELSKNIKMKIKSGKIAVSTTHKVVNILAIKKCNLMSTCLN